MLPFAQTTCKSLDLPTHAANQVFLLVSVAIRETIILEGSLLDSVGPSSEVPLEFGEESCDCRIM